MRALRKRIQYATGHIDAQVSILINYLARLGVSVKNGVASAVGVTCVFLCCTLPSPFLTYTKQRIDTTNAVIPANTDELRTLLINIKRQVAETLRNVVDVVGKYAAHCLPGEARNSVRGFILSLPSRWVRCVLRSVSNQFFLSNQFAQASINNRFTKPEGPVDASALATESTLKESQKVLTLATESSAMLKGIQEVVEASVGGSSATMTGIETSVSGASHPMKRSKGKTDSAMDISDDEDQHFEEAREETFSQH
jgi:hypothetical protein